MDQNIVLENYLNYIYLHEDFNTVLKKMTTDKLEIIKKAVLTRNIDTIKKALNFLPKLNIDQIKKLAEKRISGFKPEYIRVSKKMKKIPTEVEPVVSTTLAVLNCVTNELKKKGMDVSKITKAIKDRETFFTKHSEEMFAGSILSVLIALIISVIIGVILLSKAVLFSIIVPLSVVCLIILMIAKAVEMART